MIYGYVMILSDCMIRYENNDYFASDTDCSCSGLQLYNNIIVPTHIPVHIHKSTSHNAIIKSIAYLG